MHVKERNVHQAIVSFILDLWKFQLLVLAYMPSVFGTQGALVRFPCFAAMASSALQTEQDRVGVEEKGKGKERKKMNEGESKRCAKHLLPSLFP